MSQIFNQLHFLVFYFICHHFCTCHLLTNDSKCSSLIANVERSLQEALHYIYKEKVSDTSENTADYNLSDPSSNATKMECPPVRPANCLEIKYMLGFRKNGIYSVFPKGRTNPSPFQVYCDMKTDDGGWTVFQRRDDFGEPRETFFRNWTDYKNGFGSLNKEFWLGNDLISLLTLQDRMTLRIDLEDFEGSVIFAEYSDFRVKGEAYKYNMNIDEYSGTAKDSLSYHKGQDFLTLDRDNSYQCSMKHKGGWWYISSSDCQYTNLNGIYLMRSVRSTNCTTWKRFMNDWRCMKRVEMKIRPQYLVVRENVDTP